MKKKLTNAQIEAKLRAMYLEDIKDELMPLEEMKKRAISEYEIRHRMEQRKQKSSISRRLAVAVSIAICLIGGSFLFSALAPTMVGSANDFTRRAGIWINDVFQLGIVVETPQESPDNGLGHEVKTQTEFSSVEEASEYFGVPLLELNTEGYTLEPPVATLGMEPFYELKYGYEDKDGVSSAVIVFERILDQMDINIYSDAERVTTYIGDAFLLNQDNGFHFILDNNAYIIHILTSLDKETSLGLVNKLIWLTE